MARVTVEDCLEKVDNRFQLIHLASQRVEQLRRGAVPLIECKNKEVVVALREIAAGKVMAGAPGEELPPIEYYRPEPVVRFDAEEGAEEYEAEGAEAAEGAKKVAGPAEGE